MHSVSELNQHYGIPGKVGFLRDDHGFIQIVVTTSLALARLALQGAQLLHWEPVGQEPVIWLSDEARYVVGKSVRGGAPVCWPWFGPHAVHVDYPAHGFARTTLWEPVACDVLPDGAVRLELRLPRQAVQSEAWPYDTTLSIVAIIGATLEMDLVTQNHGVHPVTVGQALHTYFRVGDVRRVAIHGLEGCPYLDKVRQGERHIQEGPIGFSEETDRIYLDSLREVVIDDPVMQRRIRVTKQGSASTVVWNPWVDKAAKMGDLGAEGYLRMVCVENANAADDVLILPAQGTHHLCVRYAVESF